MPNGGYTKGAPRHILALFIRVMSGSFVPEKSLWKAQWTLYVTPVPLAPGQTLNLKIDDIGFGGEGVGRVEDFVVFVPFVISGEEVEVEITEVRKSFGRAKLLRVLSPSAERVAPPCPYFGACGGCQYQHIAYEAQL